MKKTLKKIGKPYNHKAFWLTNVLERSILIDCDLILEEKLERELLMKKLKETNIESPVGVTDVVEIFLDKPMDEMTDEELIELTKPKRKKEKKKEEINLEWVYKTLEIYGNVFVNEKTYNKLDEKRLGNYSIDFLKKTTEYEKDGYIIWKI